MMHENIADFKGFIIRAEQIYDATETPIVRQMITLIVRKYFIYHDVEMHGDAIRLIDKFFGKEERKEFQILQAKNQIIYFTVNEKEGSLCPYNPLIVPTMKIRARIQAQHHPVKLISAVRRSGHFFLNWRSRQLPHRSSTFSITWLTACTSAIFRTSVPAP